MRWAILPGLFLCSAAAVGVKGQFVRRSDVFEESFFPVHNESFHGTHCYCYCIYNHEGPVEKRCGRVLLRCCCCVLLLLSTDSSIPAPSSRRRCCCSQRESVAAGRDVRAHQSTWRAQANLSGLPAPPRNRRDPAAGKLRKTSTAIHDESGEFGSRLHFGHEGGVVLFGRWSARQNQPRRSRREAVAVRPHGRAQLRPHGCVLRAAAGIAHSCVQLAHSSYSSFTVAPFRGVAAAATVEGTDVWGGDVAAPAKPCPTCGLLCVRNGLCFFVSTCTFDG